MSYYYKYAFVSPEPIYAVVREELKSYMDTGAVDSLLFPTYTDKCLRKLGRSSYVITEDLLHLEDFEARLPDNFYAVREAWLCTEVNGRSFQAASSFYSQTLSTTIQISPFIVDGEPCTNPNYTNTNCSGCGEDECMPEVIQAVYKTNHEMPRTFKKQFLLKPGNISAKKSCDVSYIDAWGSVPNNKTLPFSSTYDSFDVRGNKFVTNFRNGTIYLLFYATEYDREGNQLIPDNIRIRDYIEAYLKYKVFETLSNQTNDETFQQLQQKMAYYKTMSDEAYILADIEIKKQTVSQKQHNIKRQLNSFSRYEIPTSSYRGIRYRR
jgi:hypothetical protein